MRILLTGSSGWLGQTLAPRLKRDGHHVVGLDARAGAHTSHIGSVADRALIDRIMAAEAIEAVVHSGALHKPDIARFPAAAFVAVNVQGTLNLLEAAVAAGVGRFVFTSTTSLMISGPIRAGLRGGARTAAWITEDMQPLKPRNIYGVTKLAAEHLCRMTAEEHGLPVVVLRTARFFPEADDMAHAITQSDENTKANEFLFRRLTVDDAAEAHVAALRRAPELGFAQFIVSAPTPFQPEDCAALIADAPAVVARYFPHYPSLYQRRGWSMFRSIDRVYSSRRAEVDLGFRCATGFAEILAALG
jgi:UDP-glucose 4-epimerase